MAKKHYLRFPKNHIAIMKKSLVLCAAFLALLAIPG